MEASRFGFNFPSAYKFDPTDAEIVAHYLLPRAAGVTNFPYSHALIDDNTCSCPPWELLRRHGHGGSDHAFFVGPPGDPSVNGGRTSRGVHPGRDGGPGGLWRGQKDEEADLIVSRGCGGGEMRIRYRRYNLTYYSHGEAKTSGWVMHEYHILEPKMIPGAVLSRVKITERAKKKELKKKRKAAAGVAAVKKKKVVVPGPDQAGPSNYLAVVDDDISDRDDAAFVATTDDGEGTSGGGGAQSDGVFEGGDGNNVGYVVGETMPGGYYTDFLNAGEYYYNSNQLGPSSSSYLVDDHSTGNGIALKDGDAGTSGGGTGEVTGINRYTTDFYNYDYCEEDFSSYFNQGEGSGGDFSTGEARQQKLDCEYNCTYTSENMNHYNGTYGPST